MLFTEVYYLKYHAYFVVVDHIDFAAAMAVHGYCHIDALFNLCNLKKRGKHPWRSVTKSSTLPKCLILFYSHL